MPAVRFLACTLRGETPRRWACALLASAYAFAAAGIPLPAATSKKTDELFPCATCGCGCDSAQSCWQSCCCHTLAERLAWAAKNGVTPPAFALAEAQRTGIDAAGRPLVSAKTVHATLAAKTCCSKRRTCCDSHIKSCCASHHKPKTVTKSGYIVAWRALACHGQSIQWLAAVPMLVTPELLLPNELPLADRLAPPTSAVAIESCDVPTTPPPQRAYLASCAFI